MPEEFDKNDAADQDAKRARRTAKTVRDILRKTLLQGGEARQSTEELLRALLGEVKIPREYANVILQQINATRGELLSVVADEVRTFLHDANLGEELAKILTSLSFEIRTEIRFIPNEDVLRPSVKSRVGVKSARPRPKSRVEPPVDKREDEEEFVETRGSAAIDKAIQSRVASLANMFLKGFIEVEEDEEDADDTFTKPPSTESFEPKATPPPRRTPSADVSDARGVEPDEPKVDDDEEHARGGFSPRDLRLRMSLGPDFRRRAEAAASQVASAGRVTASRSAATAASAVSAAANRAQAVVRGGRSLATPDVRDEMWKRWVGPGEPDLVGNPVIGARGEYPRPEEPSSAPDAIDAPAAAQHKETARKAADASSKEKTVKETSSKSDVDQTAVKAPPKKARPDERAKPLGDTSKETTSSDVDAADAERKAATPAPAVEQSVDSDVAASKKATAAAYKKRKAQADAQQGSDTLPASTKTKSAAAKKKPTSGTSTSAKKKPASGTSASAKKKPASGTSVAAKKKPASGTSTAAKKKATPGTSTTVKKKATPGTSTAAKKTKATSTSGTPKKSTTPAPSKSTKSPATTAKKTAPSKSTDESTPDKD